MGSRLHHDEGEGVKESTYRVAIQVAWPSAEGAVRRFLPDSFPYEVIVRRLAEDIPPKLEKWAKVRVGRKWADRSMSTGPIFQIEVQGPARGEAATTVTVKEPADLPEGKAMKRYKAAEKVILDVWEAICNDLESAAETTAEM